MGLVSMIRWKLIFGTQEGLKGVHKGKKVPHAHSYSAYKKSSYLMLNCFELIFIHINLYFTHTITTKQKQNCHNFVN